VTKPGFEALPQVAIQQIHGDSRHQDPVLDADVRDYRAKAFR
jgi:hypothetical protein